MREVDRHVPDILALIAGATALRITTWVAARNSAISSAAALTAGALAYAVVAYCVGDIPPRRRRLYWFLMFILAATVYLAATLWGWL